MKNALFTKDGKWFLIPELPEKPEGIITLRSMAYKAYGVALNEAIANALPVANPEIIAGFFNRPLNEVEKDRMYQWPGTFELTHPELGTVKILEPGSGSIWVTWKGGKTNVYHSDLQVTLILPTASGSVAAPKEEPKEESDLKLKSTDAGYKWFTCPTCDGSGQVSQDKDKELSSLRDQLRQRDELIKELLPLAERMGSILGTAASEHYKELIDRANSLIKKSQKL